NWVGVMSSESATRPNSCAVSASRRTRLSVGPMPSTAVLPRLQVHLLGGIYFFWVRTLPASVLVLLLVRPLSSAFAAVVATFADVSLVVRDCASALPASDLAVGLA